MANQKGLIQQATKSEGKTTALARPIDRLKNILAAQSVKEQFEAVLKENAGAFVASIIDLYNTDKTLQLCDPKNVVMEALKAASLKLPINKQLGFAWIVPYRDGKTGQYIPTFQLGYKGYIQLCMRTGAYRYINADIVYEGELVKYDKLTGEIEIDPSKRISDKKIGYFAFIETLNGFRKTLYMSADEVTKHAERYSKSYGRENSVWATDFDSMALKTVLRLLLSKYGIMSVEMQRAYIEDSSDIVQLADEAIEGTGEVFEAEVIEAEEQTGENAQ
ncbi:recombinase RecT [Thermoclostridium stercorarium]|uniref:recombinase RecT n=1 Tax=Thermoclostridium stercorarium TaxID=1510 RepID=UPI002248BD2A|nr:recombinase RecT [Thermoclostridium stercorarium]UZQ86011.1 recombinase RecT [Thermoclostridium stercorarium]